jgi:hypothetical protein
LPADPPLDSSGPFLPLERLGWVMRDWLEWFGWVLFLIAVVFLFVWIVYWWAAPATCLPVRCARQRGKPQYALHPLPIYEINTPATPLFDH